ncbi:NAD-dependent epimerase/dehydratase family protein [uncultured Clostridium sp.]|uniref:NAD-dependent epimerase/dehydratase family protein n=1 Tax=uncultured Clostridium sp. TaxID=59620 RepID=UPI002590B722|nr:NAD-dependent epimerase/dehydratase family protein [uncultured Clostridium sp.]
MKKILITGANSYIGNSFENWLKQWPNEYYVNKISVRDNIWKDKNFSKYDVVFHVAGIAHIKETKQNTELYYKVNRDLVYNVAKKAKSDGVKQFIFLSSMSVYGVETGVISKDTIPTPKSNYGSSKLQAEELVASLQDYSFNIAILRPPMVYGSGCKGNYAKLKKFAMKSPIFPNIENKRSMIYIDNLSEFIRKIIDNESNGLYFPQNSEYVCTSDMVIEIAKCKNRKIYMIGSFDILINFLNFKITKKVFGDLIYEKELSKNNFSYNVYEFKKTIELMEREL